jgi:hypothetical protein
MPTTRPRHMITESDRIADALSVAETIWPELAHDRSALLRKILETGIDELQARVSQRRAARLAAVAESAGLFTDVWPANWREELRDEWPA